VPGSSGIDAWHINNVEDNISESRDQSAEHPEKIEELKAHWDDYAEKNNVITPDWVSGY